MVHLAEFSLYGKQLNSQDRSTFLSSARLHQPRCLRSIAPSHHHIRIKRQRHAHAAAGVALWFTEQANADVGNAQHIGHTVKSDALGLNAAIDDGAGAACAQGGADGRLNIA